MTPIRSILALAVGAALAVAAVPVVADPGRTPTTRVFPTGSVIFFHPDGTGPNHWLVARNYFKGPDSFLNWDLLPGLALYRGHMGNTLTGTSNGGATTHAFGWKVDGLGSFGKDGDGNLVPPTDHFINNLAGFEGSVMRQAANAGIPVGVVNDGHVGEPGTGVFLAEVGNRNNWQEITRQMIQGRPGRTDTAPWVIMGGGEADTRPQGTTLLHRNHNAERGQALNAVVSLRADGLDLERDWDDNGSGVVGGAIGSDDWIVIKTRAQFEQLKTALSQNPNYAPRVLGLFGYQDTFNDRNEEDLIARGKVNAAVPVNFVGPVTGSGPGFRPKASRLILWGDTEFDAANNPNPGFNPPTFAEMTEVAIQILDRAARQVRPTAPQFFLVGEQESTDNFGNNNNAIGTLQAMIDTDNAIGVARQYLARNPRTLILTAADSDAAMMTAISPGRESIVRPRLLTLPDCGGTSAGRDDVVGVNGCSYGFASNPATGLPAQTNLPDGLEGRGTAGTTGGYFAGGRSFVTEPDQNGNRNEFGVLWAGTGDYTGSIVSRAAGLNSGLLTTLFSVRFDNIDVYRMMHATLFGPLPNYPAQTTAGPGNGYRAP